MQIVDIVLLGVLVAAFAVGAIRGFVASLGTIVGVVVGGVVAVWSLPLLGPLWAEVRWRSAIAAAVAIAIVLLCGALGSAVGAALRRGAERVRLAGLDRAVGAVTGTVATALVLLMVGQSVAVSGAPVISSAVASSRILTVLDAITPPPVDVALAQLRSVVVDDTLPTLDQVLAAPDVAAAPPLDLDDPALRAASQSVARISGTAYACGVSLTGSGFVAAPDLVVTNAHVVAGVDSPLVELPGLPARAGRVVSFDPEHDLAIVAVPGLGATPLDLSGSLGAGDAAAVEGYPLGGPLRSTGATVLTKGSAPVPDIYDASRGLREVYALAADVEPGNSGGPLLTADGRVAGIVFARGVDVADRGYAMTLGELNPELRAVTPDSPEVATGACAR